MNYRGFKGKSLIEQHRMVQKALEAELGNEIHALSIKTIIK
ncbi:MAG: BolA/IbaG family iron-sulfur metabolism protein [Candidatus Marinimicrobia bacterium]|nr:BolA/IbaG family iron-sulfur metabolism protein [Candidatus Neomarinimicrobiota bacterium]